MRGLRLILIGLLVVAGIVGGWYYHRYQMLYPSTEDVYVGRHMVQVAAQVSDPTKKAMGTSPSPTANGSPPRRPAASQ